MQFNEQLDSSICGEFMWIVTRKTFQIFPSNRSAQLSKKTYPIQFLLLILFSLYCRHHIVILPQIYDRRRIINNAAVKPLNNLLPILNTILKSKLITLPLIRQWITSSLRREEHCNKKIFKNLCWAHKQQQR